VVAAGLVIAGDALYHSEVKASHGINAVMTGIAFTGWGAPVSGAWYCKQKYTFQLFCFLGPILGKPFERHESIPNIRANFSN